MLSFNALKRKNLFGADDPLSWVQIPTLRTFPRLLCQPVVDKHGNLCQPRKTFNRDYSLINDINQHLDCPKKQTPPTVFVQSTGAIKYSPRKLMFLARQIKGYSLKNTISQMMYTQKKPGPRIISACKMLVNNAKQDPKIPQEIRELINLDSIIVSSAWVGKNTYQRGIVFHGKGFSGKLTRPFSHMKIMGMLAPEGSIKKRRGNLLGAPKCGYLPPLTSKITAVAENKTLIHPGKRLFYDLW